MGFLKSKQDGKGVNLAALEINPSPSARVVHCIWKALYLKGAEANLYTFRGKPVSERYKDLFLHFLIPYDFLMVYRFPYTLFSLMNN